MQLHQVAFFAPKGLFGRLYWYTMLPFHWLIFRRMAHAIADHAAPVGPSSRRWFEQLLDHQRRSPASEPLDVPAAIDDQELEQFLVHQGVEDVGGGGDVETGAEVPGVSQHLDESALVDSPGLAVGSEQLADFWIGCGSPNDLVDRRRAGEDGDAASDEQFHGR